MDSGLPNCLRVSVPVVVLPSEKDILATFAMWAACFLRYEPQIFWGLLGPTFLTRQLGCFGGGFLGRSGVQVFSTCPASGQRGGVLSDPAPAHPSSMASAWAVSSALTVVRAGDNSVDSLARIALSSSLDWRKEARKSAWTLTSAETT